jgi:hypothetical protein
MRRLRRPDSEGSFIHEISYGEGIITSTNADSLLQSRLAVESVDISAVNDDQVVGNNVTMDELDDSGNKQVTNEKLHHTDQNESGNEDYSVSDEEISIPFDIHRCSDCVDAEDDLADHPCASCDCAPCLWDKYGAQTRMHMTMEYRLMMPTQRYRCVLQRENTMHNNAEKYWLQYLVPHSETNKGTWIPKCVLNGMINHRPAASGWDPEFNH